MQKVLSRHGQWLVLTCVKGAGAEKIELHCFNFIRLSSVSGCGRLVGRAGVFGTDNFNAAIVVTQYIDSPWRLNWPYREVFPQY